MKCSTQASSPLPTPGACSDSCPLSRWCHPTISSSFVPFSSWLQSFPASGSFLRSSFFESGGQSIGVSASASVLAMNIQDWFPLGLTDLISLQSKGLSRVFSNTTVQKHQFFGAQLSVQLLYPYMTTGKTIALTRRTFVGKVMSLLFNMLSAATAKSLQSCPTLRDPIDGSPPGSPIPGIIQARTLEWVAISFSNAWKWKGKVKLLSHVLLLAIPWTAAHQAPPSMEVSRQEYWSGVPLPSPFQVGYLVLILIH